MDGFDFGGKWTKNKYNEFLKYIKTFADDKYREFNLKLIPGENEAIGIRSPKMKEIAKEILKGDYLGFIKVSGNRFIEEVTIRSFVIGGIKNVEESFGETRKFIPFIRNWAICDSFCAALKIVKKQPERFMELIKECLESDEEYTKRFALVMLMDYFIDEEHIDFVLDVYENTKSDKYYVNMATAWGLSVCFVKFPEKTIRVFERGGLDRFTHNKAIQKICESFRVSDEDKKFLKKIKRHIDKNVNLC